MPADTSENHRKNGGRMKKFQAIRANMSMNVIGGLVAFLLLFGALVCIIGNYCIVSAFKSEYATVTYHMADAAAVLVNGDHIGQYLAGEEQEEYAVSKRRLDTMCQKLNVSLIYVIQVDRSDYGRFVSIFNPVNNTVDDSRYTEWELGYRRDTTNDEYRENYRAIYEQEAAYGTVFRLHTTDGQHPHITTLVPVKNAAGEVSAILCMQRPVRELTDAISPYIRYILFGVFIMILLVSALAASFLKRSIIAPVETVSAEAARFAKEHAKGEPIGSLGQYDVILDLAESIESMETDMVNYMEDLTAATAEKERISAELSIAAMIQQDALPGVFPAFPERRDFDIYASMDPAKEVGGDFYNFFLIDDDHLALIMADVSDKGIPAALFMEATSILLSSRTQMGGTPAEILRFVNDNICQHNRADMFVTVWLGILELSTGRLVFANAGHEYPAVCRKNGGFELVKDKPGFVLGGMEGMQYKNHELRLARGDKLFLYTDGLPEARDHEGHMFSFDGMLSALNEHRAESPEGILEGVRACVNAFVGDAPQFDDLTMLCLELREDAH